MLTILVPFEGALKVLEDQYGQEFVQFPDGEKFQRRGRFLANHGYPEILVYVQVPNDQVTWPERSRGGE